MGAAVPQVHARGDAPRLSVRQLGELGWRAVGVEPRSTGGLHAAPGLVLSATELPFVAHVGAHGTGDLLQAGLELRYSWFEDGAGLAAPRLALGFRTAEAEGLLRGGGDLAEPWDKLLILEPEAVPVAGPGAWAWRETTASFEAGRWSLLDLAQAGDPAGPALTLAEMSRSELAVGSRSLAELFASITSPETQINAVGLSLADRADPGACVHLGELSLSFYRDGSTIVFSSAGAVTNLDTAERFSAIQAAIDDPDTLDGHTLDILPGTYPENVVLSKRLTLLGAQAGTTAVGRVVLTPDPLVETVVAPAAGPGLLFVTGSADSVVDGLAFVGGSYGIDSSSGPLDGVRLANSHFQGQSAGNLRLAHHAVNATIEQNVLLSSASNGPSLDLGDEDCDGLHCVGNVLERSGGRTASGLFANGNNNLGASGLRAALLAQNMVVGHSVGIDLGSRSFFGGSILQNQLRSNDVGLGFGIQSTLITDNVFAGNGRAIQFSSLGSTSSLHGAFGNTVAGNQILASALSGIWLDAGQAPGSIGTNVFTANCLGGNALGLEYAGSETIAAEDNWWGDPSGPADPLGSNPAVNGSCPPVPLINVAGLGDGVTGDGVDYCPWLEEAVCQALALLAEDCQEDAFPGEAGVQVEVELWMLDLSSTATGFQAFLSFDDAALSYRGDLTTYTALPFGLHIQSPLTAEVAPGELRLDGSDAFFGLGTGADALLATIVFDIAAPCAVTTVDFDLTQPFPSTVSYVGYPLPTNLTNSPGFTLDGTGPVFDPYSDITVAADADSAGGCAGAVVSYPLPGVLDNCAGTVLLDCVPPSGSFFPVGAPTTVTCTATDACGHVSTLDFDVTVTATNLVDVVVELDAVTGPQTRCIRFQLDSCGAPMDVPVTFAAGSPATATFTMEVPCGTYGSLCAKDEQHTLWDETPLALSLDGTRYEVVGTLSLKGGDNDNDGDVDIDDVTWFLAQFGSLAAPGSCPWDGTRDADYDLNGAIGSEDYTFLFENWLTLSACASCPATAGGVPRDRAAVVSPLQRRADLNGDGVIDHRDVELFEDSRGLPRDLSARMRKSASGRDR